MRRDFSVTCFEIIFITVLNSLVVRCTIVIDLKKFNVGWLQLSGVLSLKINVLFKINPKGFKSE